MRKVEHRMVPSAGGGGGGAVELAGGRWVSCHPGGISCCC